MATPLRFAALGPLLVRDRGEIAITRPAQRRLLSIFLLDHGAELSVDTLIDRMWDGDAPATARNTLQAHISALRRSIGRVLASTPGGYRLDIDPRHYDVAQFVALATEIDEAAAGQDEQMVKDLSARALALWRGAAFAELADDVRWRGRLVGLDEARLRVQTRRVDALLATGMVDHALLEVEQLVTVHPFDEGLWERLMLARYRLGRPAAALRAFQEASRILGEELGLEPGPRLRRLEEQILLHESALGDAAPPAIPHNLPYPQTSFVGRETDIAEVRARLDAGRLVSITGGPGMGKTRLALEVAREGIEDFAGGVWLARLVGASSESDVSATIAASLGVRDDVADVRRLAELVAPRPQLLVLDNCEHVLEPVRRFAAACQEEAGSFRILATSRQRLGLAGESVWRLRPLGLPAVPSRADGSLLDSEAVRLFVERASRGDPTFHVGRQDSRRVVDLVRRTDGVPLALELAASWVPSLDMEAVIEIAGAMPAPARADSHHRSLRSAVEWSFALLPEADRPLMCAAAVFRGSFELAALHQVCAPGRDLADAAGAIARLVEASVVMAERGSGGDLRYRMLEPVREYALEQLEATLDPTVVRGRHAAWFTARSADRASQQGHARSLGPSIGELDAEIADYRAAMRHLLDRGEASGAASIASSLSRYWFARYLGWEAVEWLTEALAGPLEPETRLRALWAAGWAAYSRADYAAAAGWYGECVELAESVGDSPTVARALYGLGRIELPRRTEQGRRLLAGAIEIAESTGELDALRADCLTALGLTEAGRGCPEAAVPMLEEAAAIYDKDGDLYGLSVCHRYLSLAAWHRDDERLAWMHLERAEHIARESGDLPAVSGSLIQRALVESRWGTLARAARAVIDALQPIPLGNDIDHCLIFFGAFPVLLAAGRYAVGRELFAHVDRVYTDYGWAPLDERIPYAGRLRAQFAAGESNGDHPGGFGPKSSAAMAEIVIETLAAIAGDMR